MTYVDGFIIPVPAEKLAAYKKMARMGAKVAMELGALAYVENIGDDTPVGKRTSFPRSVKAKEGEVIIFSWIVYKSKAHRNAVMKKFMADPRLNKYMGSMPFDGKRMIYGGFKTFVSA